MTTQEMISKQIVRRFNDELISKGDRSAFSEIVSEDFIDHTAPPEGNSAGALQHFIFEMLRVSIPDVQAEIHDLMADGDKVITRKTFRGTFQHDLLGAKATQRPISIGVIDILVVRHGKIVEHWGMNNFAQVSQG